MSGAREALHSSFSVEWYTPPEVVEPCREVLGTIELDPASCALANTMINADRFYTEKDDGLAQPWDGRWFCNPPYGGGKTKLWVDKACAADKSGILLMNATTDREWFWKLWNYDICFLYKRICFLETLEQRILRIAHQLAKKRGGPWEQYVKDVPEYKGEMFGDAKLVRGPQPTHGNVLAYFGDNGALFADILSPLGHVVRKGRQP